MQSASLVKDRPSEKSQHAQTGGAKSSLTCSHIRLLFCQASNVLIHLCIFFFFFYLRVAVALLRRAPLVDAWSVMLRSLPKS